MTPKETIIETLTRCGSLSYDRLAYEAGIKRDRIDSAMGRLMKTGAVILDPGGTYRLPHSITAESITAGKMKYS